MTPGSLDRLDRFWVWVPSLDLQPEGSVGTSDVIIVVGVVGKNVLVAGAGGVGWLATLCLEGASNP